MYYEYLVNALDRGLEIALCYAYDDVELAGALVDHLDINMR